MLENLKIARPCSANWAEMTGDDRARFCQLCKLHVYDLSGMTRAEAEDLITKNEGSVCVRLYKRADGTVLTKDCPVGLAAVKRRVASIAAGLLATLTVAWAAVAHTGKPEGPLVEPVKKVPVGQPLMGAPMPLRRPEAQHLMGEVMIPREKR